MCPLAAEKVKANDIFMPVMSAPPNSSAYNDQQKEVTTPRLTSVSMVAAPCPRPNQAARCSGQAPQVATGAASARLTHCQPVNCAAGAIASTMTTAASGTHTARRRASARVAGSGPAGCSRPAGAGAAAVYPVDSTTPMSSPTSRPPRPVK